MKLSALLTISILAVVAQQQHFVVNAFIVQHPVTTCYHFNIQPSSRHNIGKSGDGCFGSSVPSSVTLKLSSESESNDQPLEDLEIIDTQEGTGDVAKFESIITIKYTGRFYESGDEFDTDSMITFKLGYGKVLDGCDKGIRGMKVGGTRILKIPSRLGFGTEGFVGQYTIPPNTDLEYTVELISVASGPMAEAAAKMGIGLDPNTVYLK